MTSVTLKHSTVMVHQLPQIHADSDTDAIRTDCSPKIIKYPESKKRPKAANLKGKRATKSQDLMPKLQPRSSTIIPRSPQKLKDPFLPDVDETMIRQKASNWEKSDNDFARKLSHAKPTELSDSIMPSAVDDRPTTKDISIDELFGIKKNRSSRPLDSLYDQMTESKPASNRKHFPPSRNAATFGGLFSSNFGSERSKPDVLTAESRTQTADNNVLQTSHATHSKRRTAQSERYDMLEGLGFIK